MRRFLQLLLGLTVFLAPGLALAQTGTLVGRVTDAETGDGLATANVIIDELNTGAATDINGDYEIAGIPVGDYTIRVSFVGYDPVEQPVVITTGTNTLDLELEPDYTGLEEVVVTGIASATSRARAEVSVSRVDADELQEKNTYQDVSQLLNGKVAGVSVQPASGNVAGGIRFNIRAGTGLNGQGQPVIFVDGIRIDNSEVSGTGVGVGGQGISMLANLNPEDIESIDVLKGPAASALYGTSGPNGVVLITTKRGSLAGGGVVPFNLTYKSTLGYNDQAEEYDAFNAGTPETANAFFRQGTISQNTLSISGGSQIVRYYASYDKRFEEGHIRNNAQDRQSFRTNFEAFPIRSLTLRANAGYTLNEINRPQNDNNIFGYLGNTLLASSPFVFTDSTAIENLVDLSRISRFLGSVEAEYEPFKNFRVRGLIGFDGTDLRTDQTYPANLSYSGVTLGERNIFQRRNEQYTYDLNARYLYGITSTIRGTTIAGFQAGNRINSNTNITKQNFSTELITNVGAGADFLAGDEFFLHSREAGVFAQQEFDINNTIFITLGLRRDFASTVGEGAPAIWYPKASGALVVNRLVNLPGAISFFKIRAAYGETGQLPGVLDKSSLRWAAEPSGYGAGAVTNFIGNPNIQPERIKELELGFDSELFNNVGLEFTYYIQRAEDSIIDFNDAPSTGLTVTALPFNVGASDGWGVEAALFATPLRTRAATLDFSVIYSYQDNEVQDLGGAQPIFDAFDINVVTEGLPRSAFYTWSTRATFDENGAYAGPELTTTDADGDGEADRAFFGIPYPKHNGSFSANLTLFRNFSLSALADWQTGISIYNNTRLFQKRFGALCERDIARVQIGQIQPDALREACGTASAFTVGSDEYREAAEVVAGTEHVFGGLDLDGNFIESGDFIKLREISARYDFSGLIRGTSFGEYVRTLSFGLAARNLWMSTPYSGADPEVNFRGARDNSRAADFLTLPQPRTIYGTFTLGL